MRILVTGGAGFIGSHLCDRLLEEGHYVTVVDDLSVGKKANIGHNLTNPNFHFVEGSILDKGLMDELIKGCDLIYHLAAVVGVEYVVEDPLEVIHTNAWGTDNVLALAYEHGCKVLLASTSEIYGRSSKIPFAEGDNRVLGPTWVPRWSYSTAKALDEHLAFAYHAKGLPVTIVRYFNAYGPRLDPRGYGSVIAKFIGQALAGKPITVHGDGSQTRCFTYVEDIVRGTALAATTKEAEGEVFNIASSQETSILKLAKVIKEITASPSEIVHVPLSSVYGKDFQDTPRRVPDVSKAEGILGFRAEVPLEEGLEKTIAWFRGG